MIFFPLRYVYGISRTERCVPITVFVAGMNARKARVHNQLSCVSPPLVFMIRRRRSCVRCLEQSRCYFRSCWTSSVLIEDFCLLFKLLLGLLSISSDEVDHVCCKLFFFFLGTPLKACVDFFIRVRYHVSTFELPLSNRKSRFVHK